MTAPASPVSEPSRPSTASGWLGWVFFAGIMMIVVGVFQGIEGLTALFQHTYYLVAANQLVVHVNYVAWGWVHIILGVIAVVAGLAVIAGQLWGRVVGILMAFVSAIVNMGFISAYPLWALTVITVDILIIYALIVHGAEAKVATNPAP
jgi:hypothetical protein